MDMVKFQFVCGFTLARERQGFPQGKAFLPDKPQLIFYSIDRICAICSFTDSTEVPPAEIRFCTQVIRSISA